MTIKEVCKKYDVTADTLRYYERVGVIPAVHRTAGGIRDYSEDDLKWVETAICFRSAGMPIDLLVEYVKLYRKGDDTIKDRLNLLIEAKKRILDERKKYDDALEKLDYKISRYEKAVETGVLVWDDDGGCK